MMTEKRIYNHKLAAYLRPIMGCNCDLDNWQPEVETGHSPVCRIHKKIKAIQRGDAQVPEGFSDD